MKPTRDAATRKPSLIPETKETIEKVYGYIVRGNIRVKKGTQLTQSSILKNIELFEKYAWFFTAYPDRFIDLVTPVESNFKLFFYQRIKNSPLL